MNLGCGGNMDNFGEEAEHVIKFVALYRVPEDSEAFDRAYFQLTCLCWPPPRGCSAPRWRG